MVVDERVAARLLHELWKWNHHIARALQLAHQSLNGLLPGLEVRAAGRRSKRTCSGSKGRNADASKDSCTLAVS